LPRKSDDKLARKLGNRIRGLRVEAGMTQEQVAWSAGLNKAYMSQLERGLRLPSLPVLARIAVELGLDTADLVSFDLQRPCHLLLDAVRRKDGKAARRALERLGL
jgi:transcriptional regulator with XRE-family HTH domain